MEVNKICQFCGNKFMAKKTTTKCCSDDCAKKFYKQTEHFFEMYDTTKGRW